MATNKYKVYPTARRHRLPHSPEDKSIAAPQPGRGAHPRRGLEARSSGRFGRSGETLYDVLRPQIASIRAALTRPDVGDGAILRIRSWLAEKLTPGPARRQNQRKSGMLLRSYLK